MRDGASRGFNNPVCFDPPLAGFVYRRMFPRSIHSSLFFHFPPDDIFFCYQFFRRPHPRRRHRTEENRREWASAPSSYQRVTFALKDLSYVRSEKAIPAEDEVGWKEGEREITRGGSGQTEGAR